MNKDLTILQRHIEVSILPTPQDFIEQKQGIDYVKTEYMKMIAYKYYGGISFKIVGENTIKDPDGNYWKEIHGVLEWTEQDEGGFGIPYEGNVIAAHRIQFKTVNEVKTGTFLDLSNDIKAANTDCLKKALNLYLNISDDVYRWQTYIDNKKKKELLDTAKLISDKKYNQVLKTLEETLNINVNNIDRIILALKKEANAKN